MATEISGYIASVLVLLTFMTKDMRLLRMMAILSNVAFITYGALGWLAPVFFLHLMLLPMNIVRLNELQKTMRGSGRSGIAGGFAWLSAHRRELSDSVMIAPSRT